MLPHAIITSAYLCSLLPLPHVFYCLTPYLPASISAPIATCLILPHAILYLLVPTFAPIATSLILPHALFASAHLCHIAIRPLSLLPYVLFILVNSEIYSLYHVDCRIFKYMVTTINHTSDTLVNIG